jgi:hypothetical protein
MRVATFQGEADLTALVARLYQVPQSGKLSRLLTLSPEETTALVNKAATALCQANPALADPGKVPRGTLLVVPAVEGLQQTSSVQPANLARGNLRKRLAQAAPAAQAQLRTALHDRLNEAKTAASVLESDAVKPLQQIQGFPAVLAAMKQRAAAEVSAVGQLVNTQGRASQRLLKDLKDRADSALAS